MKIGRNEHCLCGSGVKAKRCCGEEYAFTSLGFVRQTYATTRAKTPDPGLEEFLQECKQMPDETLVCVWKQTGRVRALSNQPN